MSSTEVENNNLFTRQNFTDKNIYRLITHKKRRQQDLKRVVKKRYNNNCILLQKRKQGKVFNLPNEIREIKSSQIETSKAIKELINLIIHNKDVKQQQNYKEFIFKEHSQPYAITSITNLQFVPDHKLNHGKMVSDDINSNSMNNLDMASGVFQYIKDQSNCVYQDENPFDYFSFKIKPDYSLTAGELQKLQNLKSRSKCHSPPSPDRLISHKFFEDTENFRNTNFLNASVKTFTNSGKNFRENINNPFCNTNQSLSDLPYKYINENYEKLNGMIAHDVDMKSINVIAETSSLRDDNSVSNCNYSEREIESDKKDNRSINEQSNTIEKFISNTTYTMSEVNDSISVSSSKMQITSQERAKKVRGFNFKNNINTKKFSKPMVSSQQQEISIQDKNAPEQKVAENNSDSPIEKYKENTGSNFISSKDNIHLVKKYNSVLNIGETNTNNMLKNIKITLSNNLESHSTSNSVINSINNTKINTVTSATNSGEKNKIRKFNFNNNLHRRLLKNELVNIIPQTHNEENISNENDSSKNTNVFNDVSSSSSNGNNIKHNNFLLNVQKEREKQYTMETLEEATTQLPTVDSNNLI